MTADRGSDSGTERRQDSERCVGGELDGRTSGLKSRLLWPRLGCPPL